MTSPLTSTVELEPFDLFMQDHRLYRSAFQQLADSSRVLVTSAQMVFELYPSELGPVADDILSFATQAYPSDFVQMYLSRVDRLAELQQIFDAHPSLETLGNGRRVDPASYGVALLLSIVFTNHRFEIMRNVRSFLQQLSSSQTPGSMVSIGCGTGYELKLAGELLSGWRIAAYDTDADMRAQAHQLLEFFHLGNKVEFREYFPLGASADQKGMYDAIMLCEVLEHLANPADALLTLGDCLKPDGRMFVTMAINLAQEDHTYLYQDVSACRHQLQRSGLQIVEEWLAPQSVFLLPPDRETGFKKGNYIATVKKDMSGEAPASTQEID